MSHEPSAFGQFVLKVHSRCDLACNHCYVYEHVDQTWRGRPMVLDLKTAKQTAQRIADHAAAHRLPAVRIVLHGGEPLLLGPQRMRETLATLHAVITPETGLDLRIHTNAVLLGETFLDLFAEYDVKVGVSLDGDRAANDLHRLYRDGRSSYDQVVASLARLRQPEYRRLYAGLLCTVDVANDPVAVYRGLAEQEPPRVDLLLPHATWEHQPFGLTSPRDPLKPTVGDGEYAQWMNAIFDAWEADGRPMPIRMFESVLGAMHGRPVTTEALGLDPVDLLVIETDGTIEQVDALKTAYEGAAATGLDVWRNSLDEAGAVPGIAVRQQGIDGVSATCQGCEVVRVCGGGLYPHRYRPGHGFDNPSVYCADLKEMITHIVGAETRHGRGSDIIGDAPSETRPREAAIDDHEYAGLDLRAADFASLAHGYGSAAAIRVLMRNQDSLRRDLMALIARSGPQQDQRFAQAWDLLAARSVDSPESVDAVLAHPYTRVWAVQLLKDLRDGTASPADVHHLEAVAASAAVRAGFGEPVPVPVRGGVAPLPGFGALAAETRDRTWCKAAAPEELDLVQPLRRVDAAGLQLTIEDTDPYRDCHGYAAERLSIEQADAWARALPTAISFIDEHMPAYAPGLRAGLSTIMPMRRPEDGTERSAAARHAFGSIGAALPDDPALLALLIVHEYQHVKLGALLDIAELFDVDDVEPRYFAPWRSDPRPLEGLIQGTYAHIAVVDFWRVRRHQLRGTERDAAQVQFAVWRKHTVDAVEQLLKSGSLTDLGEQFVDALGRTLDPWLNEPVDPSAQNVAWGIAERRRTEFNERIRAQQH